MNGGKRMGRFLTGNNRRMGVALWAVLSAGVDWFIPTHIRDGNPDVLRRARLVVTFIWTLIALAIFYSAIYSWMNSLIPTVGLVTAIGVAILALYIMRWTGSVFIAGNLITADLFGVLTLLACRLGGYGSLILPWYATVPVIALSTAGRRSAVFWLAVTSSSLAVFYALDYAGYSFPDDPAQHYYELLCLLAWIGLIVLVFALALLYEVAKSQTLAELKSKNLALEELNEAAKAANRAKSEFLANMSHEIRTPMTAILGFSEVLMENVMDQEQLEAAATIKRNGEYLIGIIDDILDLSKIEAGKLEIESVQCSPCQVLSEVASLMRVRAKAKNLSLQIDYDGPMPRTIQSDPTRLRQILINLIGNAIKFTEVGKVRLVARLLDAECDEPRMQFEVIDSGIGMTEEQIAKLFNPFQQADTSTTRKFGGTGLGLTICKRLADKLSGDISVKSTAGKGSTFTVTVGTGPLDGVKLLDCPSEARLPTHSDRKPAAVKIKLDCRVLLAEDGPDNQRLIVFLLEKAGAKVVVADNGRIAYDLALTARDEGTPFDVILMDMQMPVMGGYEATAKLRKTGYTGPIIALTAHAMSTDRDKCLDAGCNDYTTKPIDHKKLISVVAEYASGQGQHKSGDIPVV